MKVYNVLADVVFWFHWIWIGALWAGIVLSTKYKWYWKYHLVIISSTLIAQLLFLGCPLVALENALRRRYDPSENYSGSFICHCLEKYFGIQLNPLCITLALLVIVALSAFVILWKCRKNNPHFWEDLQAKHSTVS